MHRVKRQFFAKRGESWVKASLLVTSRRRFWTLAFLMGVISGNLYRAPLVEVYDLTFNH